MRWTSNRESVSKGEPSVLAIAETLIAMGLTLWIAVHFDTVKHVVIGMCIAPFLLLRTDESAVLGIRICKRTMVRLGELLDSASVPRIILFLLLIVPIRVLATIMTTIRTPVAVTLAIPANWRRTVLATDSCRPPQLVPLPNAPAVIRSMSLDVDAADFYVLVRRPLTGEGNTVRITGIHDWIGYLLTWSFKWLIIIPLVGLPAMLYRWSLKSTAIIWFPLLWALRPVGPSDEPLRVRLKLFEKSDLFRIVLFVSTAAWILFVGKLFLWSEIAQASNTWNESMLGRILIIHVAPGVIERWQIATLLNSAIAIGLWFYVRSYLRHDEVGVPRRETVVEPLLAWSLFVRRLLSSYTILCLVYLYLRELPTWQLPPLGGKLFPWM